MYSRDYVDVSHQART